MHPTTSITWKFPTGAMAFGRGGTDALEMRLYQWAPYMTASSRECNEGEIDFVQRPATIMCSTMITQHPT